MRLRLAAATMSMALFVNVAFGFSLDRAAVKHRWNIFYSGGNDTLRSADVYWSDRAEGAEVIVFVHGGGWLSGDKNLYRNMAARLAGRGMTTILVNYRLSPGVKFPVHVEDVAAAIAWAHARAEKYHGDPKKIYLVGHSAGAQLISLAASDEKYLAPHGIGPADIAGVISISGVFEIKPRAGGATREYLGMVFGDDEEVWADATVQSHLEAASSDRPPFLITWGDAEGDPIKREGLGMMHALEKAGRKYRSFVFRGEEHEAFVTALEDEESALSRRLAEFIAEFPEGGGSKVRAQ